MKRTVESCCIDRNNCKRCWEEYHVQRNKGSCQGSYASILSSSDVPWGLPSGSYAVGSLCYPSKEAALISKDHVAQLQLCPHNPSLFTTTDECSCNPLTPKGRKLHVNPSCCCTFTSKDHDPYYQKLQVRKEATHSAQFTCSFSLAQAVGAGGSPMFKEAACPLPMSPVLTQQSSCSMPPPTHGSNSASLVTAESHALNLVLNISELFFQHTCIYNSTHPNRAHHYIQKPPSYPPYPQGALAHYKSSPPPSQTPLYPASHPQSPFNPPTYPTVLAPATLPLIPLPPIYPYVSLPPPSPTPPVQYSLPVFPPRLQPLHGCPIILCGGLILNTTIGERICRSPLPSSFIQQCTPTPFCCPVFEIGEPQELPLYQCSSNTCMDAVKT